MMNNLKIFDKLLNLLNSNSTDKLTHYVPRQTLGVTINNEKYYISLICDDKWQVQVVLMDLNHNILDKIIDIKGDVASIAKMRDKLYVFTRNTAYILDINNLKEKPKEVYLGDFDFQGICANENNIFS